MPRKSIDSPNVIHANPIPGASRIGPLVMSSIVPPFNPGVREYPDTIEEQAANLFANMGALLDEAGATWDDVVKVNFFVADPMVSRPVVNVPWEEHFPDPESRPARHNIKVPPGRYHLTCEFVAYVEDHRLTD